MGPNTLCAPQPTPCSPTWGSRSAVAHREKQNPPIPPPGTDIPISVHPQTTPTTLWVHPQLSIPSPPPPHLHPMDLFFFSCPSFPIAIVGGAGGVQVHSAGSAGVG